MEMGALNNLARLGNGVKTRRFSSYDVKGGNGDNWPIKAGETRVLGEVAGAGCVKHIWVTTSVWNAGRAKTVVTCPYRF